jgi:hypothetical protein
LGVYLRRRDVDQNGSSLCSFLAIREDCGVHLLERRLGLEDEGTLWSGDWSEEEDVDLL